MEGHKTKILIVDDEVGFTRLLKLNLEQTGNYVVRAEHRGERAVPAARDFHPDLVFLDLVLPDTGGAEVAQALRAANDLRGIPIVFLTAMSSSELKGLEPVVHKPVRLKEVISCIDEQLKAARSA